MEGRESLSARLRREWAAAVGFFRTAPERGRLARANARLHARAGADYVASWFSLWEGALDLAVVLLAIVAFADAFAPRVDTPWKPLSLRDPVTALTAPKLVAQTRAAPEQCLAFLRTEGVAFTSTPVISDNPECGAPDAVSLAKEARLSPASPPMDCALASAYLLWERQVVQPAARRYFGKDLDRVDQFGVYSCRLIGGKGRMSAHGSAKAIDVGGVHLADGTVITVLNDWSPPGPKSDFLHAIRDGACKTFGGALSPDYNADHRNHLHLDVGPYPLCR